MVRTPLCDKSGMRKGTWTPEEDKKLVAYVTRYGCWNWRLLPKFAGLERCGKSCRLRWMNYLRPNIKRGNYTQEEEDTIITLHQNLGNRWSLIAANLPGRTDNEIKNHWHTVLKKRIQDKSSSSSSSSSAIGKGSRTGKAKASSKVKNNNNNNHDSPTTLMEQDFNSDSSENSNNNIGASCDDRRHNNSPLSPQPSSSGFSCVTTDTETAAINHEDNNLISLENNNNDFGDLGFFDAYDEPVSADFWTEPYLIDFSYVPPNSEEYFLNPIWDIEFWGQNSLYLE